MKDASSLRRRFERIDRRYSASPAARGFGSFLLPASSSIAGYSNLYGWPAQAQAQAQAKRNLGTHALYNVCTAERKKKALPVMPCIYAVVMVYALDTSVFLCSGYRGKHLYWLRTYVQPDMHA